MIARKTQKIIYNIVIICLLIGGVTYVCSRFIHLGNIEYTDNAQVKQHITPINTRVPGFIKKIYFDEYQQVRKGDTLLIIEDAEFRLRVAQAEADLANATAGRQATTIGIATTQNNLSVSDASIEEVRVQMENAKRELNRFEKLLQEDAVTKPLQIHKHGKPPLIRGGGVETKKATRGWPQAADKPRLFRPGLLFMESRARTCSLSL